MSLSDEEELELLALLEANNKEPEPLADFISRVMPTEPAPEHVDPIIKLFEESRYREVRATISMPPRHAKTVTGMNGLAWRLCMDPSSRNAFCAYGADLAMEKSREIQKRAIAGGAKIDPSNRKIAAWSTIQGGGLIAPGVGGPIVGKGITGIAWIDDPFRSRADADSPTVRDKTWKWFQAGVLTRLERGASCVVVCTRWHLDDLIGRIQETWGDEWQHISIPAVRDREGLMADERVLGADGKPVDGVYRDDVLPLWPEQYPISWLAKRRRDVGEFEWWSQYQGSPIPAGNVIFAPTPARYTLKDFKMTGHRIIIAVDPAATKSARADYSVITVMAAEGYGEHAKIYVLEVQRDQCTIPELVRRIKEVQTRWGAPVACEAVSGFKAVPQMLLEVDPNIVIVPVELKGDKFMRSQPYANAWNDGRVLIPVDAPWAKSYIDEHVSFSGTGSSSGQHDDQVDAGAHGYTFLARASIPRSRDRDYRFVNPYC